jgi:hypothetical protein
MRRGVPIGTVIAPRTEGAQTFAQMAAALRVEKTIERGAIVLGDHQPSHATVMIGGRRAPGTTATNTAFATMRPRTSASPPDRRLPKRAGSAAHDRNRPALTSGAKRSLALRSGGAWAVRSLNAGSGIRATSRY